jgi:hypothetical protein
LYRLGLEKRKNLELHQEYIIPHLHATPQYININFTFQWYRRENLPSNKYRFIPAQTLGKKSWGECQLDWWSFLLIE